MKNGEGVAGVSPQTSTEGVPAKMAKAEEGATEAARRRREGRRSKELGCDGHVRGWSEELSLVCYPNDRTLAPVAFNSSEGRRIGAKREVIGQAAGRRVYRDGAREIACPD